MLVAGFPAGAWGTNCYLVAPAAGEECVIIDPGHEAAPGVDERERVVAQLDHDHRHRLVGAGDADLVVAVAHRTTAGSSTPGCSKNTCTSSHSTW